jgi:hypothetical protein
MREILLWGGEIRGKSDNILQYILLPIYCIGYFNNINILHRWQRVLQYIVLVVSYSAIYLLFEFETTNTITILLCASLGRGTGTLYCSVGNRLPVRNTRILIH